MRLAQVPYLGPWSPFGPTLLARTMCALGAGLSVASFPQQVGIADLRGPRAKELPGALREQTAIGALVPSWNIHIAQSEQLFSRNGAVACTVRDRNAFLFGALVPDIPVGYMVPDVREPIAYRITHFATPEPIPKPREHEFWADYVAPAAGRLGIVEGRVPIADAIAPASIAIERETVNRIHYPQRYEGVTINPPKQGTPADEDCSTAALERSGFDLLLGVWTHLLADNIWNTRVNEFLDALGDKPSEQFRIKKQGDFDWCGKTLPITSFPRDTPRLIAAAAAFPQYELDERTVLMTIGVAHEIVRENQGALDHPPYRLLTSEFFSTVSAEVVETTDRLLAERLQGARLVEAL